MRQKSLFAIIVGMVLWIGLPAWAESPSKLLEKGIYTEETVGDLDAAMKIYAQIVADADANRRYVAQARYRLGMCYLKQGKGEKALAAFEKVISEFPEEKKLVAEARKHIRQAKKKTSRAEIKRIVEKAVKTISTCHEGDPRVGKSLASLEGLDEKAVVGEVTGFLDSKTATVRRSAIYVLWKGEFESIAPAAARLEKLCSHKEVFTRGMAALALGASRVDSSFATLCDMTLQDPSGYARRCAAYALGLMGRADARPVLEKALKDSDALVGNNAREALILLSGQSPVDREFPEFVGCRIKKTVLLKVKKGKNIPTEPHPESIHEFDAPVIRWEVDSRLAKSVRSFNVSARSMGAGAKDTDPFVWKVTGLPATKRYAAGARPWKAGVYSVRVTASGASGTIGTAEARLTVKPLPYTQIVIDEIRPDGTIHFRNIIQQVNRSGRTVKTLGFINSDFVEVKRMSDDQGRPIKFTAKHDGSIYRYNGTLNEPVPAGEVYGHATEGTMTGLVKRVGQAGDTFQYRMTHSPGANAPTRRIEVYRLPKGAELLETTPANMARRTKNGQIELFVEKRIPSGGRITTAFRYRLPGVK